MSINANLTDSKQTRTVIYKKSVRIFFALMKVIEEFKIKIISSKKK